MQLPLIEQIQIRRKRVEEYYGISITFRWAQAPLPSEFTQQIQEEVQREFRTAASRKLERDGKSAEFRAQWQIPQPRRGEEIGDDALGNFQRLIWGSSSWSAFPEDGLVLYVLDHIRLSAEWIMFYNDPAQSPIDGPLDGTDERWGVRTIPQFTTEEFLKGMELSAVGGEILFEARDA